MHTNYKNNEKFYYAGTITFALRLVVGWTYFSAFWRRLVLENKLDPDIPGYIGEKFNHFLPNALGIKPLIEYLVTHPEALWWAMAIFTIIEAIAGLFFMLGLFTRLMSITVFLLAMGILLGSGWLGTTCLDEWQIGVLGIAAGFTIFLSGGGKYALDQILYKKSYRFTHRKWFAFLSSGELPVRTQRFFKIVFTGSFIILLLTLFTNQYFHGGVWGKLHNKSVRPRLELSQAEIKNGTLNFEIYRIEGADVYGSFLIGVKLMDSAHNTLFEMNGNDLSALPSENIHNKYVAKIKPGKHSLVIPLGAKATLSLPHNIFSNLQQGNYTLLLTDISGIVWEKDIKI